jgi:hypothetical protein
MGKALNIPSSRLWRKPSKAFNKDLIARIAKGLNEVLWAAVR